MSVMVVVDCEVCCVLLKYAKYNSGWPGLCNLTHFAMVHACALILKKKLKQSFWFIIDPPTHCKMFSCVFSSLGQCFIRFSELTSEICTSFLLQICSSKSSLSDGYFSVPVEKVLVDYVRLWEDWQCVKRSVSKRADEGRRQAYDTQMIMAESHDGTV